MRNEIYNKVVGIIAIILSCSATFGLAMSINMSYWKYPNVFLTIPVFAIVLFIAVVIFGYIISGIMDAIR